MFSGLQRSQWITLASLVAASLLAIATGIISGFPAIYLSLAAATTVTIFFDRVNRYLFENEIRNKRPRDLRYLGNSKAGIRWLAGNLTNASAVNNTVFCRLNPAYHNIRDRDIEPMLAAAKSALSRECYWTDLFLTSERKAIDDFISTLSPEQLQFYSAIELKSDVPMLQMTEIIYADDKRSVLFGFGFAGGKTQDNRVFVNKRLGTVLFFGNYFEALKKVGTVYKGNFRSSEY